MNLKDLEFKYRLPAWLIEIIVVLHSLFLFTFDSLLLLFPRRRARTTAKVKTRLLVIKLDAIGDFILWLDFARGLRELYPRETTEIALLANCSWSSLAEAFPYFDRVLPIHRMKFILNPFYRMQKLLGIRREGFDTVIDPAFSREFQFSPPVARLSGAPLRIAAQGDLSIQRPWQKKISDQAYTRFISSAPGRMMELIRNAEFLRGLGHKEFRAEIPVYKPAAVHCTTMDKPYYVIFPGAGWVNRQWPLKSFAELASRIYSQTGYQGIICGGPAEQRFGRLLKELSSAPLEDWTGRTSLAELASLIAGAHFLIGNETSAVHLAAAVSIPAVCIIGGGHFGRFLPYEVETETRRPRPIPVYSRMDCYGCNWRCIYKIEGEQSVPCVTDVPVDAVYNAVKIIMDHQAEILKTGFRNE